MAKHPVRSDDVPVVDEVDSGDTVELEETETLTEPEPETEAKSEPEYGPNHYVPNAAPRLR